MANTEKKRTLIQTLGDAFVITAGFSIETAKKLIDYGIGSALTIVETKDNAKIEKFRVAISNTTEGYSRYGVSFSHDNENNLAELTLKFPFVGMTKAEKEEYLAKEFAEFIKNLNTVQDQMEKAKESLKTTLETAKKSIKVAE